MMSAVDLWKRRTLRVATELSYLWAIVALVAVAAGVLLWVHPKQEVCIRWWGGALQLFGIWMVVRDLRGARRQFGQDGIWGRIKKKLRTWPGRERGLKDLPIAYTVTGHTPRVRIRKAMDPATPVEARLDALEANFLQIDKEMRESQSELEREARDRIAADKAEAEARAGADAKLHRDMVEQATGSYGFSMFGVVWLAVGLVLSTGSPELARWAPMWLR